MSIPRECGPRFDPIRIGPAEATPTAAEASAVSPWVVRNRENASMPCHSLHLLIVKILILTCLCVLQLGWPFGRPSTINAHQICTPDKTLTRLYNC